MPRLSEFRPRNPCLLGINISVGNVCQDIKIRLRRASDVNSFYSFEHVRLLFLRAALVFSLLAPVCVCARPTNNKNKQLQNANRKNR